MNSLRLSILSSLLLAGLTSSCRITHVDSREGPARIVSHGLVEGHAAFGILAESQLLHIDIFEGSSEGAIFELGLWKLLRLEIGLAGASASVGPLHVGLGVLDYEPRVPSMVPYGKDRDAVDVACSRTSCSDGSVEDGEPEVAEAEPLDDKLDEEARGFFIDTEVESTPVQPVFEVDPKLLSDE